MVPQEKYCVGCGYSQVSLRQNLADAKCFLDFELKKHCLYIQVVHNKSITSSQTPELDA